MPRCEVGAQAVSQFQVVGLFGQQILTSLGAANSIVEVGEGRHSHRTPGRSKGDCPTGVIDSQGHRGFGDETGLVGSGIQVPCSQPTQSQPFPLEEMTSRHIQVDPLVAQGVRAVSALSVLFRAQTVAHDSLPSNIKRHQAFTSRGDKAGKPSGPSCGGPMKVGALVPRGCRSVGRYKLSRSIRRIKPFALAKQFKPVLVVSVVNAAFPCPISGGVCPGQLALPQFHLFKLFGEVGGVEVLSTKCRRQMAQAPIPKAEVRARAS